MKFFVMLFALFATIPVFAADVSCPAGSQLSEYTELEYIKPTGVQWIDTRVVPDNANIDIDLDFTYYSRGTDGVVGLFGDGFDRPGNGAGLLIEPGDKLANIMPGTSYNFFGVFTPGERVQLHWNVTPGGTSTYSGFASSSVTSENHFGSDVAWRKAPFKTGKAGVAYYGVKIALSDTLVRDFVPVRRVSDGAIGMYDRVSGEFYGNSGTGEFIAGPDVANGNFIGSGKNAVCESCPANTYKPNAGNEACTPCPVGAFSPTGSTSLSDCAKILQVGNYMAYMPMGRRTEHGLCTMLDGVKYCADLYEKE